MKKNKRDYEEVENKIEIRKDEEVLFQKKEEWYNSSALWIPLFLGFVVFITVVFGSSKNRIMGSIILVSWVFTFSCVVALIICGVVGNYITKIEEKDIVKLFIPGGVILTILFFIIQHNTHERLEEKLKTFKPIKGTLINISYVTTPGKGGGRRSVIIIEYSYRYNYIDYVGVEERQTNNEYQIFNIHKGDTLKILVNPAKPEESEVDGKMEDINGGN